MTDEDDVVGDDPDRREPGRSMFLGVLRSLGVGEEAIPDTDQDEVLMLQAVEHLVDMPEPDADLDQAALRAGISVEQVRQIWRSLGFTDPAPGERVFTDQDIENMATVGRLVDTGAVPFEVALQVTRVLGSSSARIAESLIDAVAGRSLAASTGKPMGDAGVAQAAAFLPQFSDILLHVWRRHLQTAARRRLLRAGGDESRASVVGFADLVQFTALSQQLSNDELAGLVGLFEQLAYDVILAGGGRVVKTIGDEVMFLVDDVVAGAEIALGLAEASRDTTLLPDVRVGLALGPVLERDGDVYGPTVNLASRITGIAHPGSVVVPKEVRDELEGHAGFALRPIRARSLKHLGRVPLWTLVRRADDRPNTMRQLIDDQRRLVLTAVRERLASLGDLLPGDVSLPVERGDREHP